MDPLLALLLGLTGGNQMAEPQVSGGLASYGYGPQSLFPSLGGGLQSGINPLATLFSGMGRQDGSMGGGMGLPTDFWQSLFGGMAAQPAVPTAADYFNQFFGSPNTASQNQTGNMVDPGLFRTAQPIPTPPPAYTGPTPIGVDPTLWNQSLGGRSTAQGGYSQDPNFWQNMNQIATGTQTFTPWTQAPLAPGVRGKPARSGFSGIPVPYENTVGSVQNAFGTGGIPNPMSVNTTPTIGNTGIMGTGMGMPPPWATAGRSMAPDQVTGQTILDYINRRR